MKLKLLKITPGLHLALCAGARPVKANMEAFKTSPVIRSLQTLLKIVVGVLAMHIYIRVYRKVYIVA